MNKIGIVVKPDNKAIKKSNELEEWLRSKGIYVVKRQVAPIVNNTMVSERDKAPHDLDCIFVLGGDGTFLSAARWIADQDIPLLGVKFGEVGFLAETTEDDLFHTAAHILENQFQTKNRMRLFVQVLRNDKPLMSETVLNDVVINNGALARLAQIKTHIDDHYLTTYRADGLILATPTGSTAYSLAAGGPIIHPAVPGLIMTPICPFTLTNRPLIVPDSARITLQLKKKSSDIMLTFDGQEGIEIDHSDMIIVEKSNHPIKMISLPDQEYFDVLKAKLHWSGSRI